MMAATVNRRQVASRGFAYAVTCVAGLILVAILAIRAVTQ